MSKVISLGEALIDSFLDPNTNQWIDKCGGAPANVAVCCARQNVDSYFVGNISLDIFGEMIYKKLEGEGVCLLNAPRTPLKTARAKVSHDVNGDRQFVFERVNTADLALSESNIPNELIQKDDIVHFCSVCLVTDNAFCAHRKALMIANQVKAHVSFDVNLRPQLWSDLNDLKKKVYALIPYTNILKMSDEELEFLYDMDEREVISRLFQENNLLEVVFITRGSKGSSAYLKDGSVIHQESILVKAIDTTGAGDCFIGSILSYLLKTDNNTSCENIKNALNYAARAASLCVSKVGGIDSMPMLKEI